MNEREQREGNRLEGTMTQGDAWAEMAQFMRNLSVFSHEMADKVRDFLTKW